MKVSIISIFCIYGISLILLNDISEATVMTNDRDIGPYIRTLRRYPVDFDPTAFDEDLLEVLYPYLHPNSDKYYGNYAPRVTQLGKRAVQSQPLPMKVRITRSDPMSSRFAKLRRSSENAGVQNSMLGIGIGDHMARL